MTPDIIRPVRLPWHIRHCAVVSLYDMLNFTAGAFITMMSLIQDRIECFKRQDHGDCLGSDESTEVLKCIKIATEECTRLDLQGCHPLLERLTRRITAKKCTNGMVVNCLRELHSRITDDLGGQVFLFIPTSGLTFLREKKELIETVFNKFPSAIYDFEEAARCYAFERFTACVFHLMRVMEVGLKAVGANLQLLDPNPTWEAVLKKCDQELAKPIRDRNPSWKAHDVFFSDATADLRAVKNAWRNPTMHVEKKYTEEEARDIFHAVRGFMRHLSTKLNEHGGFH